MARKKPTPDFSIARFQEGSLQDFNYVFECYYDTLYVFAYNLIFTTAAARDMATASFVKCWHAHAEFENIHAIKAFLYRATGEGCLNYWTQLKRQPALRPHILFFLEKSLRDEAYLQQQLLNAEVFSELLREIECLPAKCRDVVRLSYFKNLSTDELANELRTSCRDVLYQKARGVRILRSSFLKKSQLPAPEYFFLLA